MKLVLHSVSFWGVPWLCLAAVCLGQPSEPRVVQPGPPPTDAVILFDGKDLSQWQAADGGSPRWEVKDGVLTVVRKTGAIRTKQAFGDCQLHVEWASPEQARGDGQDRGNSGIFLQGRYEVQILDSWKNKTYANGQAGAVYNQHAPLVNASRRPGEWQIYDIIYHGPRFNDKGELVKPAVLSLLHNAVLVQDQVEVKGRTAMKPPHKYEPHALKEPLTLQDHGHPVRFRNIWIRDL